MVYRGKLSKACAECRAKKTRCDGARPSCGQCRRATRVCSGYRNVRELRVIDQSSEVSTKLATSHTKRKSPASGYGSPIQVYDSSSSDSHTSEEELVETGMVQAFPGNTFWVEGIAKNVFFDQYINIGSGRLKTDLQFATAVQKTASADGMFDNIISALGIGAICRGNMDLSFLAAKRYSSALRQTHLALQHPTKAKSDETLATVLLLGLHELVAANISDTGVDGYCIHLQGAVRLLQIRGHDQIDAVPGSRMMLRVCSQILHYCLFRRILIPASLLQLHKRLRPRMNEGEAAAADLFKIAARLCEIRVSPPSRSDTTMILTTLQLLLEIDQDIIYWKSALAPIHEYEERPVSQPDKSFLTHHHIYTNHLSGSSWNQYRCLRICIHEEILLLVSFLPATAVPITIDTASSVSIIQEMCTKICHSVPYFLGQGSIHDWEETPSPPPSMYGASTIMIALYFASNPERVSPAMYTWLIGQVAKIERDTGMARAGELLKRRTETENVASP